MHSLAKKLIIGSAQFGLDYGIANSNGIVNTKEIKLILDLAQENNINVLDTAKAYGNSEKYIGEYLKLTDHTWNIITKIINLKSSLVEQIQDSKMKLSIFPSTILAHSLDLFLNPVFQLNLEKIKNKEFVKSVGVSIYNEEEIKQVLDSKVGIDIIQIPMNILDTRLYKCGILDELKKRDIEIHVRSVFLQGLFYLSKTQLEDKFKDVIPYLQRLEFISKDYNLTVAELSLLWLVNLKEISKVIVGVNNVSQLKNHIDTLNKNVDFTVFKEALLISYENENILNPSLWPAKS